MFLSWHSLGLPYKYFDHKRSNQSSKNRLRVRRISNDQVCTELFIAETQLQNPRKKKSY